MKVGIDLQRLCLKASLIEQVEHPIDKHRQIIQNLNQTRKNRLESMQKQIVENSVQISEQKSMCIQGRSICKQNIKSRIHSKQKSIEKQVKPSSKNEGVGDIDKMVFDKKFKNYLNHKQQFEEAARKRRQRIKYKRKKKQQVQIDDYYNQDEILSNTGSDYQYKDAEDMLDAWTTIATGKRRKKGVKLFYGQQFQFAFRLQQFEGILSIMEQPQKGLISKDILIAYLFQEPMVMMLYSINPYLLGDELSDYQTQVPSMLAFEQFSNFLLIDREPTYFAYTAQNLEQARKIGRGLKCAPIVGKWIDQSGILQDFMQIFDTVDMFGNGTVDGNVLVKKLLLHSQKSRILDTQVIDIININKLVPVSRILYEMEHQMMEQNKKWTKQQFKNYLLKHYRIPTPDKDKLITKLIMAGKYDTSYIYIVSTEVLETLKQTFSQMQKFAEFFVKTQKFISKFIQNKKYPRLKNMDVRSQTNRYVIKQTVQDTLVRMLSQADPYIDIQQIMDFFTNRGRPRIIQYKVYLANLERQLAIIQAQQQQRRTKAQQLGQDQILTSSDEEFQNELKARKLQRKKEKLKNIQNSNRFNHTKKFNVTIPVPFGFDVRDKSKKMSIRQRKVKQMLQEKRNKEDQAMKPIIPKEVPKHVKQNLYEKITKDQQRQRLERLERFRIQIQNSMVPMPDRLVKPKQLDIHCDFTRKPYEFVARPMPWYCQVNLLERINRKKQQRRQRILQQIINRHHDNDLPEGVLRMLQRHEALKQKRRNNKQLVQTNTGTGDCTFIPKITHSIPNFEEIHQNLNIDLQIARQNKKPVHPQPFSFETRQKRSRTHNCLVNQQKSFNNSRKLKLAQNKIQIKPTQKFIALVKKRKLQKYLKQQQADQELKKQQIRKLRQMKFAPRVLKVLRQNDEVLSRSRNLMQEKIKQFQRQQKQKKKEHQEQMIKIYAKVWNRPLLIQNGQYGQNQAKNNSRYNEDAQINEDIYERYMQEQIPKQAEVNQKKSKINKKKVKHNKQLEDKRRRVVEQPPGQYLLQDKKSYDQQFEVNDEDQMAKYIQDGYIDPREYQQMAAQMMHDPNMRYQDFDEDDDEDGEYLSNQGLRTS